MSFVLGFGIDQLRDDCMDTYWQSDGQLPHLVNIQFQRKTMVSHIYIYTDYKLDESYTPSRISIRAGTHFNDLQEIEVIELIEPSGKTQFIYFLASSYITNSRAGKGNHMLKHSHSSLSAHFFEILLKVTSGIPIIASRVNHLFPYHH